jgi:hypothetical protein
MANSSAADRDVSHASGQYGRSMPAIVFHASSDELIDTVTDARPHLDAVRCDTELSHSRVRPERIRFCQ